MARSDEELLAEASRLASLDESGLALEWIKRALRLGDLAQDNADELARMDREWLNEYLARYVGGRDEGGFPGSVTVEEPVAT